MVNAAMRVALEKESPVPEERVQKIKRSRQELKEIVDALREEYQAKNPGRDPLAELFTERREAARRGE